MGRKVEAVTPKAIPTHPEMLAARSSPEAKGSTTIPPLGQSLRCHDDSC